jgi:hypothetical protein
MRGETSGKGAARIKRGKRGKRERGVRGVRGKGVLRVG